MAKKALKPTVAAVSGGRPSAPAPVRPDAASLRRVAAAAKQTVPSAVPTRERQTVLVNVKVASSLADALADRAAAEGITQKQVICRALAAYGLPVDPLDLEDRTRRRQRAA